MWMWMGEKKSISEEVELQLFLIMAFFVATFFFSSLFAVQYSKQSSSAIAYISTVRNGRQRIKNRHQKNTKRFQRQLKIEGEKSSLASKMFSDKTSSDYFHTSFKHNRVYGQWWIVIEQLLCEARDCRWDGAKEIVITLRDSTWMP